MVYPVLKINQNDYLIEFVDTESENELVLQFEPNETCEIFYTFLCILLEQYNEGYIKGLLDK